MKNRNHPLFRVFASVLALLLLIAGIFLIQWRKSLTIQVTPQGDEAARFDCREEVARILQQLPDTPADLQQIRQTDTLSKVIALNFEGSSEPQVRQAVTRLLQESGLQATFFLPGHEISSWDTAALRLQGSTFESYGYEGVSHMENLSLEAFATSLCRGQMACQAALGTTPDILKLPATQLNDEMLSIAKAAGFSGIVTDGTFLNYASFTSQEQTLAFVKQLQPGAILNVKLSGALDALEYKHADREETPAVDKQPENETLPALSEELTSEEKLIQVVQWLLTSLKETGFQTVPVRELPYLGVGDIAVLAAQSKANAQEVPLNRFVYTTDREAGLVFHGISDPDKLDAALKFLQENSLSASFVVYGSEAEANAQTLEKIRSSGFEILSGGQTGENLKDASYEECYRELYLGKTALDLAGIKADVYFTRQNVDSENLRKAAGALDLQLMGYGYSLLKDAGDMEGQTPSEYLNNLFTLARPVLCRGDIVYLDLDVAKDAAQVQTLLSTLYQDKVLPTAYEDDVLQVVALNTLLDNTWDYPAGTPETLNRIQPEVTKEGLKKAGDLNRYVRKRLPSEYLRAKQKDKSVPQRVAFLTIDDFGDEQSIGRLLSVLRKHNIKATFFVITINANDNRVNLVRAMAEEGHDVGSHTDTHHIGNIYTQADAKVYAEDLWRSNQTLANILGDTEHLTAYLRPPTLSMSPLSVETVLGCGYSHIIGADMSTQDYKAESVEEVVDRLTNGSLMNNGYHSTPKNGSIFVLHMTPNSLYTAQGLDEYLTYNESLPEGDKKKFSFQLLSDWIPEDT